MLRGNAQYLTSFLIVKRTLWAPCQYSRLYRNLLGYQPPITRSGSRRGLAAIQEGRRLESSVLG